MANRPKPTRVKQLEGNPGKRPLNKSEPIPAVGDPVCPEFLTEKAQVEFWRVCSELRGMGLLHSADTAIIACLADSWAEWRLAKEHITKGGHISMQKSEKGNPYPFYNPWLAIEKRMKADILRFSAELGLTPSARSRITISEQAQEDEMEKILGSSDKGDKKANHIH